jgi:hypothetical protein
MEPTSSAADRPDPGLGEQAPGKPARVPIGADFWPYPDLAPQPTDEELAALDPDLRSVLFNTPRTPLSITLVFPRFDGPDYEKAVTIARASREYRETGEAAAFRHQARFLSKDASSIRDLWDLIGTLDAAEVLLDDRRVPYARELWLPLLWFLTVPRRTLRRRVRGKLQKLAARFGRRPADPAALR